MKRLLIILLLFVFSSPVLAELDYDRIYKDTPVLDYMYETGVDDDEQVDYQDYIISPYVLIRIPTNLRCKNVLLQQGYYLVKAESKNGYRFAVFKQNGRVAGVVPIYQKSWVNPDILFPKPPQPKYKWYVKPFVMAKNIIKWPFKKLFKRRLPLQPPRALLDYKLVDDGKYYDMHLYIEDGLYKMLFKLENNL